MALVTQETMLFNDTITKNIQYGNLKASNNDIEKAANLAGINQFTDSLDNKLKPTTYYNEALDRLGFGAEIIYLYIHYYDKRVKRRTIKDALLLLKPTKK
mgnify:CR=1 FL=1